MFLTRRRRSSARALREYERIAEKDHFCDACQSRIAAGDEYWGLVIPYGNGKLLVLKQHMECPIDPLDEERLIHEAEALAETSNAA
jgi:hypothetical protein